MSCTSPSTVAIRILPFDEVLSTLSKYGVKISTQLFITEAERISCGK